MHALSGAMALVALAVVVTLSPPAGTAGVPAPRLNLTASGITIATSPAVPNFPVTLDGVTERTDGAGRVHFDAEATSDSLVSRRLTPTEAIVPFEGQDVKASSGKLYPFGPVRILALNLSYHVRFSFSGLSGAPVDPAAISKITVKSPLGEVADVSAREATWLQGSRTVRAGSGLAVEHLEWTVQGVQFAGSNVVNISQQRFRPAEQQSVAVKLLFFSLKLHVHDTLFGHPQDGAVELVYPDGHAQRFRLDDRGQAEITALPRGQYTISIQGAGPALSRPLAVSRDQDLDLSFYSWWDIVTLLGTLAAIAVCLAVIGAIRRRRSNSRDDAGPARVTLTLRQASPGDDDALTVGGAREPQDAAREPQDAESPSDVAVLVDRHAD
jgi:hypothetical protein